jgi:hypothetical protein
MSARQIGWFIIVTGMITALPLILEVSKEIIAFLINIEISCLNR